MTNFTIDECFSQAIKLGKQNYWAIFFRFLITIILSVLAAFTIIGLFFIPAIIAGFYKFLIRSARGESKGIMDSWKYGFQNGMWLGSLLLLILMAIGIFVGYLLLLIPGIYLTVAWALAWFLLVDKGSTPTESMGQSRDLVHSLGFWRVFGVYLITTIAYQIISIIPVVNFLIFFISPFYLMVFVAVYEKTNQVNSPKISKPSILRSNA